MAGYTFMITIVGLLLTILLDRATTGGDPLLLFYVIIFICIPYLIFLKFRHKIFGKYATCPICEKSILVYDRWRCDYCNNVQTKDRFVYQPCTFCKKQLKRVYCEHCHGEIGLFKVNI